MRTTWTVALLLAVVAGAILPAAPALAASAAQGGPPASLVITGMEATAARVGGTNQITAYVMLVDAGGRPVRDVQVESAHVRVDDGAPAPATVSEIGAPVATLLVLDASGSMVGERADAARTAVINFVNTKQPDDRIGVVMFNDTIVYSNDFTTDRVAAISAASYSPAQRTPGSCLWDVLYEAVGRVRRLPSGQRAILLVTDGHDQTMPGGPACSQRTLDDVIQLATEERARVPISIMGLGNAQNLSPDELAQLARATGGQHAITDIGGEVGVLFAGLVEALRAAFTVSAEVMAGSGAHDVEIGVTLADGGQFLAVESVTVPATVFVPPTQPPAVLPTQITDAAGSTRTPTVISIPAGATPAGTGEPPDIAIVEARQDAGGDLVLRLNVQERAAPVTAVIVLLDGQPLSTLPPGAFGGGDHPALGRHRQRRAHHHGGGLRHRRPGGARAAFGDAAQPCGAGRSDGGRCADHGDPGRDVHAQRAGDAIAAVGHDVYAGPCRNRDRPHRDPCRWRGRAAGRLALAGGCAHTAPAPDAGQSPAISPALIVIGAVVLIGGLVLAFLWWRSRRIEMAEDAALVGDFRYDYYADEHPRPAVLLPPAGVSEPTQLYDEPREERTALYVGDRARARLEVIRSLDTDARVESPFTIEAQRVTLGRDSTNDICFRGDRFVSSQHVRILYMDGSWILEELGALNKTFVNGTEVTGRVFLKSGDLIELGPYTRIRFTTEEPDRPPDQPTAPSQPTSPLPRRRGDEDDEDVTRIHRG
ncbi:MAG: FHA domain-containing protein [Anaerolineae bacterium]|nr:FHA domain-containing protein [Anaerolineae bacterium]